MLRAGFENRVKPKREAPAAPAVTPAPAPTEAQNALAGFAARGPGGAATAGMPGTTAPTAANRMDDATAQAPAAPAPETPSGKAPSATDIGESALQYTPGGAANAATTGGDGANGAPRKEMPAQQGPGGPAAPPTASPSGFVSFDQYLNANAASAKDAASGVNAKVNAQTKAAHDALAAQYDQWRQQQQYYAAHGQTDQIHDFKPTEGLAAQYNAAGANAQSLGTVGGVQAQMAPGASAWDAALAQQSGTAQPSAFADFDKYLTDTTKAGSGWAAEANARIAQQQAAAQAKEADKAKQTADAKAKADAANAKEVERANSVARVYDAAKPKASPWDWLLGNGTDAQSATAPTASSAPARRKTQES